MTPKSRNTLAAAVAAALVAAGVAISGGDAVDTKAPDRPRIEMVNRVDGTEYEINVPDVGVVTVVAGSVDNGKVTVVKDAAGKVASITEYGAQYVSNALCGCARYEIVRGEQSPRLAFWTAAAARLANSDVPIPEPLDRDGKPDDCVP